MANSVHPYIKGSTNSQPYVDWNRQLEDKARYEADESEFQHIAQVYLNEGRVTKDQYLAVLDLRKRKQSILRP